MEQSPVVRIIAVFSFGLLLAAGCADGSLPSDDTGAVGDDADADTSHPPDPDTGRNEDTSSCVEGSTRVCGKSTGTCQQGTATCTNGTWGPCKGAVEPTSESCDGKDNDCDGQVDEIAKCSCKSGETQPCGKSTGVCQQGTQTCSSGQWGACKGQVKASSETCDNKDNDCDGQTDENLSRSCGSNTGVCQKGTQSCSAGSWGNCTGRVRPSAEMCDNKDNDCDGQTDENLSRSCGSSTGVCTTGTQTCSSGQWGSCTGGNSGSSESCDNKDNDCDGQTDENLSRSCGTSTGVCTTGTETCTSGSWSSCSGTSPSKETCDGKDNDCDGKTDERTWTLKNFDFEGPDPAGWDKVPYGHSDLKISDDVTSGTAAQGSEYAKAWYKHGTCKSPSGIGEDFKVNRDIDIIKLEVKIDVGNWGRAAIFLKDSNGNVTKLWRVNAQGSGYSTNGWKTLRFDETTSFTTTTSSGAKIEQNSVPYGVGNESIWLIFGTDDNTSYCTNLDHNFTTRVDAVKVIDECY